MKKSLFVYIILIVSFYSFSQTGKIDSVYKVLKYEKVDTSIVNAHINLCFYYGKTELIDSGFFHGLYANKLALKHKFNRGVVRSYIQLGNLYFESPNYDSSIYYFKQALLNIKNLNSSYYYDATRGIGNNYFYLGDYINALNII